jgi:putative FmdB family regulatory protein
MPLLEFRCADCEKTSELLVLAGDEPAPAACPSCGSRDLLRLLSTFAAHAGAGGARTGEAACGDGSCAMPGMCGPSACGLGEN